MEDITYYKAPPTASRFHRSKEFIRLLIGPVGSGKSVTCVEEILLKAMSAKPSPRGIRYSKFCVIRNTARELRDTTIKTYKEWIDTSDPRLGYWREMEQTHYMRFQLPDNTWVQADILFRALDTPKDIKKLFSLELTWIFFNEVRFIDKEVFETAITRTGRYPPTKLTNRRLTKGEEYGVFADTNPPDTDHWIYHLFEELKPADHQIFHQPSGTSNLAENIDNLPQDYYDTISTGKDPEWIKVFVHGKYGLIKSGLPVYPSFSPTLHIDPNPNYVPSIFEPIRIGIDFGRTPAACLLQYDPSTSTWYVFDELVTFNMGATQFGELLADKLKSQYSEYEFEIVGDPAGEQRSQVDDQTPFDCLFLSGIDAYPATTQDPVIRKEAVNSLLNTLSPVTGQPKLIFNSPESTPILIKAFSGGYQYRRLNISGSTPTYQPEPLKNKFSHVAEALEYSLVSSGVTIHDQIISSGKLSDPIDYSQLNKAVI